MKNEDIKFPELPHVLKVASTEPVEFFGGALRDIVQAYARETVRLNVDGGQKQRSDAWEAVCVALNSAYPEWMGHDDNAMGCAVVAIQALAAKAKQAEQPKPQEPKPFDLEAAKRGEALVTRDGHKAFFIAYDEGASENSRLLVRIDGYSCATAFRDNGQLIHSGCDRDLFMAPKPKRTVWVNLWAEHRSGYDNAKHYESEDEARKEGAKDYGCPCAAVAVPVEIEA